VEAARTVVVAGASGLVGREILQGLLADDSVAAVHSLGRRELPIRHPKLTPHRVDFKALPALPRADEAFVAFVIAGSTRNPRRHATSSDAWMPDRGPA